MFVMKKVYLLFTALLLAMSAAGATVQVSGLKMNGYPVTAFADSETKTLTLGNGQNACIPHHAEAFDFTIPGTYEGYEDYTVVIAPFAFRFCSNLTHIKVGEGVTAIGDFAFVGCGGTTAIDLPSTLLRIGCGAFMELGRLTQMTCCSTTPPVWDDTDVFSYAGTPASMWAQREGRTLYVPEGTGSAYKDFRHTWVGWYHGFAHIYEGVGKVVEIGSYDELAAFRDNVNEGKIKSGEAYESAKSFLLTADIDLTGKEWTPIGVNFAAEEIIFDGGGHTIKGLKTTADNYYQGFFREITNSTVRNLHFQQPEVSANSDAGVLAGRASPSAGGLIGYASNVEVSRCYVEGKVESEGGNIGGIIGCLWKGSVTDCIFGWQVSTTKVVPTRLGGIVGTIGKEDGLTAKASITRSVSWAKLSWAEESYGELSTGALVGLMDTEYRNTSTPLVSIVNCGWYKQDDDASWLGHTAGGALTDGSSNKPFTKRADMIEGGTLSLLDGGDWDYFYDVEEHWQNYPIPTSLKQMYADAYVNLPDDESGLVYQRNIGECDWEGDLHTTNRPVSSYNVVGYTGSSESLTIPDNYLEKPVVRIGSGTFQGATFSHVHLPASLYAIDGDAFRGCQNLMIVDIPDATERIETMAFADCTSLQNLNIGKNTQYFGDGFIANCPKLTSLTVNAENTQCKAVDQVLFYVGEDATLIACAGGNTGDYTVPLTVDGNDVKYIRSYAFAYCDGLTSITFQRRMENIDNSHSWFLGSTNLSYVDYCSSDDNSFGGYFDADDNRTTKEMPCYGLNANTLLYLSSQQQAYTMGTPANTVIASATIAGQGDASCLWLTDQLGFSPKMTIVVTGGGVTYKRLFDYGNAQLEQASAVCLPYAVNIPSTDVKVYRPVAVDATEDVTTVVFDEIAKTSAGEYPLQAYTPYYMVVSGITDIDFSNKAESITITPADATISVGGYAFNGTTEMLSTVSAPSTYVLQSDGIWHKVDAEANNSLYTLPSSLSPFTCYFQTSLATAPAQLSMQIGGVITLSDTGDNTGTLAANNGRTLTAVLQGRTLYKDGSWNTLCLPFDVKDYSVEPNGIAFEGTPLEGATAVAFDHATFTASTGTLEMVFNTIYSAKAGEAFLVKWDKAADYEDNKATYDMANPVFKSVTINNTQPDPFPTVSPSGLPTPVSCIGLYNPLGIEGEDRTLLYLGDGNNLYYPNAAMTIGAFRCYFKLNGLTAGSSAGVRQFVLNFGDGNGSAGDPARIHGIEADEDARAPQGWYTLDGRRLSGKPTASGIYMYNGRKTVIK